MSPDQVETMYEALGDLGTATLTTAPRPGFAGSLRERIHAEARALQAEAAEAFQQALDGAQINGEAAALSAFVTSIAPRVAVTAPPGLRAGLRSQITGRIDVPVRSLAAVRARTGPLARARTSMRFAVAAALASSMIATSALAVAASSGALPGDTLYGVKRFRERVQTWGVAGLPEGIRLLVFAGHRIDEIEGLSARRETDISLFEIPARDLESQALSGTRLILQARAGGDRGAGDAVPALARFLEDSRNRLLALETEVPEDAQVLLGSAIAAIERAADMTETVATGCIPCAPGAGPLAPGPSATSEPQPCTSGCIGSPPVPIPPRVEPTQAPQPQPTARPTPPTPPKLEPVPDPDRIPNLPGRIDDELEEPFRRLIEEFLGAL